MFTEQEKSTVRELAWRYMEIAQAEDQQERIARARAINDLTPGLRPTVWFDELPWHELNATGELTCTSETPFAREVETFLRRALFTRKYFDGDTVYPPYYPIRKTIHSSGIGIAIQDVTLAVDQQNNIVSHHYEDRLSTEEDLAKLRVPVITTDPAADALRMEQAAELLGGILPPRLTVLYFHFAPWDLIAELRGAEPLLMDLFDRPEFMHRVMEKFTEIGLGVLEQYEALGLLAFDQPSVHCTPAYTSALPQPGFDGVHVRAKDIWFRGTAQIFSSVSPAMHEEFELVYMARLFERCGLVYYGCCEPLDNKIHLLKRVPNMRKIGVSPWAKVARSAEQMGGGYVLSRKPNPAHVATRVDPAVVRAEIEETAKACLANGTPYEMVLKDISTAGYRLENLVLWEKTVRETLDRFYR